MAVWGGCVALRTTEPPHTAVGAPSLSCLGTVSSLAGWGQAAVWVVGPGGWLWSTVPVGEVKRSSLLALPVMVHPASWT